MQVSAQTEMEKRSSRTPLILCDLRNLVNTTAPISILLYYYLVLEFEQLDFGFVALLILQPKIINAALHEKRNEIVRNA